MRHSICLLLVFAAAGAQSLGSAGTLRGKVTDPSGARVAAASLTLTNDLTLYRATAVASATGEFQFTNIPPNPYHLEVSAPGFQRQHRDVDVRGAVPVALDIALAVESQTSTVTVGAETMLLETTPSAHTDVDQNVMSRMAAKSAASGLSDVITMATPGVVADSDGFFHAMGDHAQASFSIDNQPITDQQGVLFSTQIPANAIQSLEASYGGAAAEYGDKTSLVITAVTRSGLGQKPHGSLQSGYGSFGTFEQQADLGFGGQKWGQFFAANGSRSGRFLDTPELRPMHAVGNSANLFSRTDYQPGEADILHLNLLAARNWFQTPNTYAQQAAGQDQRQRVQSYNIAPGWVHVFSPTLTWSVNPYFRQDQVNYYGSRNPLADQPGTLNQARRLTNAGVKTDLNYVRGRHNAKAGVQISHTLLTERFSLGLTDPAFNPVCVDAAGATVSDTSIRNPEACAAAGYSPNPDMAPGLLPHDLTRGGSLFRFHGHADIRQQAFYAQDSISLKNFTLDLGLRFDRYDGLSQGTQAQPRTGLSYHIGRTGTVLRAAYSHSYETPLNENLVLSGATGAGGLAANVFNAYESVPLKPGIRNQYNAGLSQALGRHFVLDADYFWKFTRNAFDLDNLFSTAIYFPIEWDHSKMDGVSARLTLREYKGLSAFTTLGHTRARVFGPENGGLIFDAPVDRSVVRIDHDQALQSTTNIQYQFPKRGPWVAFTWRYDSGIVAGAVPDLASVLALTAGEQAQMGFYCGSQAATPFQGIASCNLPYPQWGATRVNIPAPGTANDDLNPARVRSRHLFNLGVGTDDLLRRHERVRLTLRAEAMNLSNAAALYNFLSTCAGTHFVAPRTVRFALGVRF